MRCLHLLFRLIHYFVSGRGGKTSCVKAWKTIETSASCMHDEISECANCTYEILHTCAGVDMLELGQGLVPLTKEASIKELVKVEWRWS